MLQEAFAFGTTRRDILVREARIRGFNYFVESDRKNIFDLAIDGGLLILSRFKIVESAKLEFERGVHNDWYVVDLFESYLYLITEAKNDIAYVARKKKRGGGRV